MDMAVVVCAVERNVRTRRGGGVLLPGMERAPERTSKCHCIPSDGFMVATFSSSALT